MHTAKCMLDTMPSMKQRALGTIETKQPLSPAFNHCLENLVQYQI